MRILGFSIMWDKLSKDEFTTFRCERKDKDWQKDETVQIYFKPRSKYRKHLGNARIVSKELRPIWAYNGLSDTEAQDDGFANRDAMLRWMIKTYGKNGTPYYMNKLTLRWTNHGNED